MYVRWLVNKQPQIISFLFFLVDGANISSNPVRRLHLGPNTLVNKIEG